MDGHFSSMMSLVFSHPGGVHPVVSGLSIILTWTNPVRLGDLQIDPCWALKGWLAR